MSEDWDIKCLACNETHGFDDANHQVGLMRTLINHAAAIAAVAPLLADPHDTVEFRTFYGSIDASWFAKHLGHELVPVSEYGRIDGTCGEWHHCGSCTHSQTCDLEKGHEGPHGRTRPR